MSTPEILMLLWILPKALRDHPEWFSAEQAETARRLLREMQRDVSSETTGLPDSVLINPKVNP